MNNNIMKKLAFFKAQALLFLFRYDTIFTIFLYKFFYYYQIITK